jgi:putative endonuclease
MYYCYVLQSQKDHHLYIGFSSDLKRRLQEHHTGKVPSTKGRRPLQLLYYEAHHSETDARRREQYFKTDKGKSTLRLMLRNSLNNHT